MEIEHIMKERIRYQRLILDYQDEQHRLLEENRRWKKFLTQTLEEKSRVQHAGQSALLEATNRYRTMAQYSNGIFPELNE